MAVSDEDLSLGALRAAYAAGSISPTALIKALYPAFQQSHATFIHLVPHGRLSARCQKLEAQPVQERGVLWGVPFAVKDNVDVADMPTTAACPSFAYTPEVSAPGVQVFLDAGAIMVGKTNMDQFAAGLVGTRSPYGVAHNAFDHRFVPGGSSSGSAVAVATNLVTFALGTDTAGSGRVPAGLNGCVGVKGTLGSVCMQGVVPACAALDCLTIFACSVEDGAELMTLMRTATPATVAPVGRAATTADTWRRQQPLLQSLPALGFRFAVPSADLLDWDCQGGPSVSAQCQANFDTAIARLQAAGGRRVDIDFTPLLTAAAMLYTSSFVAERYSGIRKFLDHGGPGTQAGSSFTADPAVAAAGSSAAGRSGVGGSPATGRDAAAVQATVARDARLLLVTRTIISGAGIFSATDVFDDLAKLAALKGIAQQQLACADLLLVPTALSHFTVAEVLAEETASPPTWNQNAKLGRFTNFVNLLDMCGISVPSGLVKIDVTQLPEGAPPDQRARAEHLSANGPPTTTLPFGVTLLAAAWRDEWLWGIAGRLAQSSGLKWGPKGHGVEPVLCRCPPS